MHGAGGAGRAVSGVFFCSSCDHFVTTAAPGRADNADFIDTKPPISAASVIGHFVRELRDSL